MSDQPLFYQAIVPLNRDMHRQMRLAKSAPYAFAAGSHLIPAVMDEFPSACGDLPILYVINPDGPAPVFVTGLTPGRNSFVTADGTWGGLYVPAYVRRYPFILGDVGEAGSLICIDERSILLRGGEGSAALFNADGSPAAPLAERIELVTEFAASAKRTQVMGQLLLELGLLKPVTNQTKSAGSTLEGLLRIDEAALDALSSSDFLRLRADGMLGAIYTHLVSLRAIVRLAQVPPQGLARL